jgi:hypothetical protein
MMNEVRVHLDHQRVVVLVEPFPLEPHRIAIVFGQPETLAGEQVEVRYVTKNGPWQQTIKYRIMMYPGAAKKS